jgi:hypothetical protein
MEAVLSSEKSTTRCQISDGSTGHIHRCESPKQNMNTKFFTELRDKYYEYLITKCETSTNPQCYIVSIIKASLNNQQNDKKFWEELIAYFPRYNTGHIENDASNNSSIVACVFVTAVTFLPSRCLAPTGGFLPSRCLATLGGCTYRHTDRWEGLSNESVEMGSGAMIYIPSFIKIRSGIKKLRGIHRYTHTHTHTDINVIS